MCASEREMEHSCEGERAADNRYADLCLGRADVLAAVLAVDALEVVPARPDVVE